MSGIDSGNPNAAANSTEQSSYEERECPMCGATCKKLPAHLRNNCEVTQ